jgi:protein-L-isoaspartate(D-aspartate) O-methyltransferase
LPEPVATARREFAERIRSLAGLETERLVSAFASVPREAFVGPGPWQIMRPGEVARGYVTTPDGDPRHLYDNVLVALDSSRQLNNGEPASLARWLDALRPLPGNRFLHIGCGVGYYTAIVAEAVVPGGAVVGVEIDAQLAELARSNLRPWSNVNVVSGDGSRPVGGSFDAIFVNAGVTQPLPAWLDALRVGGRLLVPLTVDLPQYESHGAGYMLLVSRQPASHAARFVSPVGIFHCAGARTDDGADLLRRAYRAGGLEAVRSLRLDSHDAEPQCWLHAQRFCLSQREATG